MRAIALVASGSSCASASALARHGERASSSRNVLAASCRKDQRTPVGTAVCEGA